MSDKRDRRAEILTAAVTVAERDGLNAVSREAVANEAGCSPATVSHHFGTMAQLRRALMRRAVHTRALKVVAMGLAAGDKYAHAAPAAIKSDALDALRESI